MNLTSPSPDAKTPDTSETNAASDGAVGQNRVPWLLAAPAANRLLPVDALLLTKTCGLQKLVWATLLEIAAPRGAVFWLKALPLRTVKAVLTTAPPCEAPSSWTAPPLTWKRGGPG